MALMTFQAQSSTQKGVISGLMAVIFLTLSWQIGLIAWRQSISSTQFLLALLTLVYGAIAFYLSYYAFAYFRLNYTLNRNGLQVKWGLSTYQIPIDQISTVYPTSPPLLPDRFFFKLPIPGWWVGQQDQVIFLASTIAASVVVRTTEADIIISPKNREQFIQAWQQRQHFGVTQRWSATVERPYPFNLGLWSDQLGKGLLGGLGFSYLVIVGALSVAYPNQPATPAEPYLFDHALTAIAQPQSIQIIGVVSLLFVFNLLAGFILYKREPVAVYLLWGLTIVSQMGIWFAVQTAIT